MIGLSAVSRKITAATYLTIEPAWRGRRSVFLPFEAEATVTTQDGEVGQVRVVVEPFRGEPDE